MLPRLLVCRYIENFHFVAIKLAVFLPKRTIYYFNKANTDIT